MSERAGVQVIVVGGGVSGLSCAVRLLEAGHPVELWTRDALDRTTSNVAAAVWYPYRVGPEELTPAWGLASYAVFKELTSVPGAGVSMRRGVELFAGRPEAAAWRADLDDFRALEPGELPDGYASGYASEVPVIEMPVYLPWLAGQVRDLGGTIVTRDAPSLDAALAEAPVVVNCAGLGARELAGDAEVYPIRGQIVRVSRGEVDTFLFDEQHPEGVAYIVPRSGDCVLGGTAEIGVEGLEVDPAEVAAIVARCEALDPRLAGARVLGTAVGLRPGRREVRLELEPRTSTVEPRRRAVIHDYGHGGAGVTLSWGCAAEVARLLKAWCEGGPGSDSGAGRSAAPES